MVMAVLRNYKGAPELHPICRELVVAIPEDDTTRRDEIEVILESTGVVSGEFGFANAYERKKEEILLWLTDPSAKVREFAENYIRSLDRRIAAEKQHAEQDLELRKRNFEG